MAQGELKVRIQVKMGNKEDEIITEKIADATITTSIN